MADEASVSKHTVAQLKALLTAHDLPTTGNKPDLVARVLANPHVLQEENAGSAQAAPQLASGAASAKEKAPTAATSQPSTSAAASAAAALPISQPAATSAEDELAKRQKRAERFGLSATPSDGATTKKAEREERFGVTAQKENKSIAKLDSPLKAQGKGAKPEDKAKAPPANIDPARLAEEEEKKRKRAERFGAVSEAQPEKKAKAAV